MTAISTLKCPNCLAPLNLGSSTLGSCPYCAHTLLGLPTALWPLGRATPWPGRASDRDLPRVGLGRHTYVLLRRLDRGRALGIWLARRDALLTELVVIKVQAPDSQTARTAELSALERLAKSRAPGAGHYARLLPQVVAQGVLRKIDGHTCPFSGHERGLVTRFGSGFVHTLDDANRAYPKGVPMHALVWMWKRLLELLSFVHRSHLIHGALYPSHILLHPRDHAVRLVGFSESMPIGNSKRFKSRSILHSELELPQTLDGHALDVGLDLTLSSFCVARSMGAASKARNLSALLKRHMNPTAGGRAPDALTLRERVDDAARRDLGPPRYRIFEMPI